MAPQQNASRSSGNWWLTGVLLFAGFGLLYWAGEQFVAMTGDIGFALGLDDMAYALWLLTIVASGLMFGLAILAAQRRTSPTTWAAMVWAGIPLAVLVYSYLTIVGAVFPDLPDRVATFLLTPSTQTACALLVGFFMAVAAGSLVLPSGRRH